MNITTTSMFEIKHKENIYEIAGWYRDSTNTITLTKLCNEVNIIMFLEHEYVHATLLKLEGRNACEKFDNLQESICENWY